MTTFGMLLVSILLIGTILYLSGCVNKFLPVMANYKQADMSEDIFKVYFYSDSANVSPSQEKVLKRVVVALQRLEGMGEIDYGEYAVYVSGNVHSGKNKKFSNAVLAHDLALQRAESVAKFLVQNGISEDNIIVKENGDLNPEKYKKNDVVDIVLRKIYKTEEASND